MKLFEYQAKELFEEVGIPIPKGRLVSSPSELDAAVEEVGVPCVIKAQVLRGGRGKAGLIQLASTAEEARRKSEQILDSLGNGRKLLVEQALNIDKEIYLSITMEPETGSALVMISAEGGTIELDGTLDEEQRARLLAIANRCPVHLTLTSTIDIRSRLA